MFSFSDQQVIYRTLPKWESLDPFGEEGQQQLRVTNIRIRLLKHQSCPCQAKDPASAHGALPSRHFAIYDMIVKGSCFCNGHAEQCVPAPGYQPIRDRTNHVVRDLFMSSSKCISIANKLVSSLDAVILLHHIFFLFWHFFSSAMGRPLTHSKGQIIRLDTYRLNDLFTLCWQSS